MRGFSTKSRKKIFDSIPKRQKIRQNRISVYNNDNENLIKKIDDLQNEIFKLRNSFQKSEIKNREYDKQIKLIIQDKNKQINEYIFAINDLSQQLTLKNREIETLKLEIIRISRCNNLIK